MEKFQGLSIWKGPSMSSSLNSLKEGQRTSHRVGELEKFLRSFYRGESIDDFTSDVIGERSRVYLKGCET